MPVEPTKARIAFGLIISFGDGASPEVFTEVGQVSSDSIGGPTEQVGTVEATHMRSPNGRREWLPTLTDSGDVTFEIYTDPANVAQGAVSGLKFLMDTRARRTWRIEAPGSPALAIEFEAFVTSRGFTWPREAPITNAVTLKVTGDVVMVA